MKSLQKTILTVALFGAASTLSHSAVLYTYAGTTINEASTSVPSMSLSRNTSSTGTLYFKYTVTNPASNSTNEDYYAGMQLYDSGAERIGIGNAWALMHTALLPLEAEMWISNLRTQNQGKFISSYELRTRSRLSSVLTITVAPMTTLQLG